MGLNVVRFLSIVTLLLVFASQIVVMVTNIKAVNEFEANAAGNLSVYQNCDYIEYVCSYGYRGALLIHLFKEEAPYPINPLASSGLL